MTVALLAFLFPLAYSPGPGNMVFAANGARFGLRATVRANIGYHIATWLVTMAIGFGFAVAIAWSEDLFFLIQWAGAAYVLYLAWRLFRAGALEGVAAARPAGFRDGVLLLVLNPKAYVIIVLMFSQFLGGSGVHQPGMVLWITTVFTANNLLAFVIWTMIGDRIAARFRDNEQAQLLNRVFGAMLGLVAVWMAAA